MILSDSQLGVLIICYWVKRRLVNTVIRRHSLLFCSVSILHLTTSHMRLDYHNAFLVSSLWNHCLHCLHISFHFCYISAFPSLMIFCSFFMESGILVRMPKNVSCLNFCLVDHCWKFILLLFSVWYLFIIP